MSRTNGDKHAVTRGRLAAEETIEHELPVDKLIRVVGEIKIFRGDAEEALTLAGGDMNWAANRHDENSSRRSGSFSCRA
jgi:hypothetical protein